MFPKQTTGNILWTYQCLNTYWNILIRTSVMYTLVHVLHFQACVVKSLFCFFIIKILKWHFWYSFRVSVSLVALLFVYFIRALYTVYVLLFPSIRNKCKIAAFHWLCINAISTIINHLVSFLYDGYCSVIDVVFIYAFYIIY